MTVVRTPPEAASAAPAFLQEPPRLTNTFDADPVLAETLERLLPEEVARSLRPEWRALGEEAAGPLAAPPAGDSRPFPTRDGWGPTPASTSSPSWRSTRPAPPSTPATSP